jgi:hypothetical protein
MPRATSAYRSGRSQEELADEVCDWDYGVGAGAESRDRESAGPAYALSDCARSPSWSSNPSVRLPGRAEEEG